MEKWEKDVINEFLKNHFPKPVTQNSLKYFVGQSLALNAISKNNANFILKELENIKKFPVSMMIIPRSNKKLPFGVPGGYKRKPTHAVTDDLLKYAKIHQEQRLKKLFSMMALKKINEKELRRRIVENSCGEEEFKYWWT